MMRRMASTLQVMMVHANIFKSIYIHKRNAYETPYRTDDDRSLRDPPRSVKELLGDAVTELGKDGPDTSWSSPRTNARV